jgi:hypothetical protein
MSGYNAARREWVMVIMLLKCDRYGCGWIGPEDEQTWPTPPLPLWGVKPTREPFPNSDDSNEHTR